MNLIPCVLQTLFQISVNKKQLKTIIILQLLVIEVFLYSRGNIPNNAVPNDLIDQAASQNFYYQPGGGHYGDVVRPPQGKKVPFLMHQTTEKQIFDKPV